MNSGGLSVVIPTRGRSERLKNLLDSLRTTDPKCLDRVVIVDDTPRVDPSVLGESDPAIQIIHSNQRRFISRSKNIGWRSTTSPLVAFVDDDNCLTDGLLDRLAAHFLTRPRLGAVTPGVLYKSRPDLVWVYACPFRADRWAFELIGRNRPRDARWENRWLPTDALPNLSVIRRETLEEVGGLDERFPMNSSADLCQRIKRANWEVAADTGALTLHDVEPPGSRAFWAEHLIHDPERMRHEIADWFRFQRTWNGSQRFFRFQATWHALGFLLPNALGVWVRTPSPRVELTLQMVRGYLDAIRQPTTRRGGTAGR